jgi:nucleotide-binding universal stress UspA family protein
MNPHTSDEEGSDMFRRIVVPLDGTSFAETALAPASELARTFDSQLLLVRAFPHTSASLPVVASEVAVDMALEAVDDADAYLHDVAAQLRAAGCCAEIALYIAEPGTAIVRTARLDRADLIVMTAHTRWQVRPMSTPSTTIGVLARSTVPILAWRPAHRAPNRPASFDNSPLLAQPETPIIVPLDGSLLAESALPYAESLARAFGTYLVLTHALAPADRAHTDQEPARTELPIADATDARQYLEVVRREILDRGSHATSLVRVGHPFQVIERCWREFGGSLIVTATRGQTGSRRGYAGSVARRLIEEVEAHVLVIPPEQPALDTMPDDLFVDGHVNELPVGGAG